MTVQAQAPAWLRRLIRAPKHRHWEDYFEPGENLLWQGRPVANFKSPWGTFFVVLFGLPFLWAGIAHLWILVPELISTFDGFGNLMKQLLLIVVGSIFVCFGALLVFGGLAYAFYGHTYTHYALTNKRAYIARDLLRSSLETHVISSNDVITLEEGRHETIILTTYTQRDSDGDVTKETVDFEHIDDAAHVYKLIRQIQSETQ